MNVKSFAWMVFLFFLVLPLFCRAETRYGLELSDIVLTQENIYDTETLADFGKKERNNTVVVSPFLEYTPSDKLSVYLQSDLFWVHYFETHEDEADADLSSAFVGYQGKMARVFAGFQPFSIGRGFILDDSTPGLALDFDFKGSSGLSLRAAHVEGASTVYAASVHTEPGLFENIELFGAVYHDTDDITASLLDAFYVWNSLLWGTRVAPLTSSHGDLYYLGVGADVFVGNFFIKASGILQKGTLTFATETPKMTRDIDFTSFLTDLEISRNISDTWSVSGLLFIRSGGRSESDKLENHTFVTPKPMGYRPQVFSNDQFGPYLNESGFYSQGIVIPGLVSPGLSLSWTPVEKLMLKTTLTLLYPYSEPGDGASFYGWEGDFSLSYSFAKRWDILAEAGYFRHGDFFIDDNGNTPDPSIRVLAGVKVSY